jgi:hypothetical protein
MNLPPKNLDAEDGHTSVTHQKLGKIWQFTIGSTWFVAGLLGILAFACLSDFLPPPSTEELCPVSGVAGEVSVHQGAKGVSFASFSLKASGEYLNARINNYNYLSNYKGLKRLLQLNSGEKIIAWFRAKDIAEANNAVVWRIQHAGEDLLTLEQSSQAHNVKVRRFLWFVLAILGIGATLMFWGWRIWLAEQKNAQSSKKSISSPTLN